LYYEPVFISPTGQVLQKKKANEPFDIMVDGGLKGNFPIFIFDRIETRNGEQMRVANAETLGFRMDTPDQISYDDESKGLAPVPIEKFSGYVGAFYNYIIENLNRSELTSLDWDRTVSISSGNIGPKVRRLSPDEKRLLIANGREATQQFFGRLAEQ
jgi:NTE family protein